MLAQSTILGDVVVIGGCGFLGHHIVSQLKLDPTCSSVSVINREPFKNRLEGVDYYTGDVTSRDSIDKILTIVRPKVIINTASPVAYIDHEHAPEYFTVNVDGNKNLLESAAGLRTVKAYVYTSSGPIIAGSGGAYTQADETYPTLVTLKKGDPYHMAKALGDKVVLEANGRNGIRTATIRPTAMYGEGDQQMTGNVLDALRTKQQTVWLGDNTALMDSVYVGHVAKAHILAAQGILAGIEDSTAPKVDGEAFNITDDRPEEPWTFFRRFWLAAGDETPVSKVTMIPPWLVLLMTLIAEWWCWAVSLGKKRPKLLIQERIEFILYSRTYNIEKARDRLGYEPTVSLTEAVQRSVDWALKENPLPHFDKKEQ